MPGRRGRYRRKIVKLIKFCHRFRASRIFQKFLCRHRWLRKCAENHHKGSSNTNGKIANKNFKLRTNQRPRNYLTLEFQGKAIWVNLIQINQNYKYLIRILLQYHHLIKTLWNNINCSERKLCFLKIKSIEN